MGSEMCIRDRHGILHTENAAGLYEKYGFREVEECDDKTMEKPKV